MKQLWCFCLLLSLAACNPSGIPMGKDDINGYIVKVADWQIANPEVNEPWVIIFSDWAYAPYLNGLFAVSQLPGNERYLETLVGMGEELDWTPKHSRHYANDHAAPQTWLELYEIYKDTSFVSKTVGMIDGFMEVSEMEVSDLDFKPENYDKWSWCDALYMSPPTFARLGKITGDRKYYDYLHKWWWRVSEKYYDSKYHLFYRDQTEMAKMENNGKPVFWSRGNGWVTAGLVRVIQYLDNKDPMKEKYVGQLIEMLAALAECQQPDGLWHAGLLDPDTWTQPETSGSALILYSMAYAVNEGYVDRKKYEDNISRAWIALCGFVGEDGKFTGVQPVGAGPDAYDPDYTIPYGPGAFLLAASEVYKMAK